MLWRIKRFLRITYWGLESKIKWFIHKNFYIRDKSYFDKMHIKPHKYYSDEKIEIDDLNLFKPWSHNFHNIDEAIHYYRDKAIDFIVNYSEDDSKRIQHAETLKTKEKVMFISEHICDSYIDYVAIAYAYETYFYSQMYYYRFYRLQIFQAQLALIKMMDSYSKMEISSGSIGADKKTYYDLIIGDVKRHKDNQKYASYRRGSDMQEEHLKWKEEAVAIKEKYPDWSNSQIARQVIKNLSINKSAETVRKVISK